MLAWYRREARDLPWRADPDPYSVWLAEIIFQQTRIDQGLPYYLRFKKNFPTVQALAKADVDRVLKLWEGLGYYARARNLHKAARDVVERFDGRLPDTVRELQSIPGIGPYTAGAIASIAFNRPEPVVDGNVKRVLARLTNFDRSIDEKDSADFLWDAARILIQGKAPGDFNQALMDLGARTCTPKNPQCAACPLDRACLARRAGTQSNVPFRTPKKAVPHHEVVVAAISRRGRYLIGKRPANGLLGGLWEFPGGKVKPGEDHATALRREIDEEIGLKVNVGGLVASVDHVYSHLKVTLNVYRCEAPTGTPKPKVHTGLKWVYKSQFADYAFPKANHKFLELL